MSKFKLSIRFTQAEHFMIAKCVKSEKEGDVTPSELFRKLLHREYTRRFLPGGKVKPKDWQTDHRFGRPGRSRIGERGTPALL